MVAALIGWAGAALALICTLLIGAAAWLGAQDDGDRRELSYIRYAPDGRSSIWLTDVERRLRVPLLLSDDRLVSLAWSPDGERLAFVRYQDGAFVLALLALDGGGVRDFGGQESSNQRPAWSSDGHWLAFERRDYAHSTVMALAVDVGEAQLLAQPSAWAGHIRWSPRGDRIAYSATTGVNGSLELYTLSTDCGTDCTPMRLGEAPGDTTLPTWSPDGEQLAFMSNREGAWRVYVTPPGCLTCAPLPLTYQAVTPLSLTWSPDGRWLGFEAPPDGSGAHIHAVDMRCVGGPEICRRQLTPPGASYHLPDFSPDGRWVAFTYTLALDDAAAVGIAPIEGCCLVALTRGPGQHWSPVWRPPGEFAG